MKTLLIHGYGKALDPGEKEIPRNGGFYIFDSEIGLGTCIPFIWSLPYKRSTYAVWNPFDQLRLYWQERRHIEQRELLSRLHEAMMVQKPKRVICHSMGARLFLNVITQYGFPQSVQEVVLVQADIPRNISLPDRGSIRWKNIWCWWDMALVSSWILNRYLPAGLVGIRDTYAINIFFPLKKGLNLHQGVWRDETIRHIIDLE